MKTKTLQYEDKVKLFWIMVSIIVFCFAFYVYFVNVTIRNTVSSQNFETEISSLNSKIGEKEFSYISLKNKINIELAYAKGFKETTETKYISRKETSSSLSFNTPNNN